MRRAFEVFLEKRHCGPICGRESELHGCGLFYIRMPSLLVLDVSAQGEPLCPCYPDCQLGLLDLLLTIIRIARWCTMNPKHTCQALSLHSSLLCSAMREMSTDVTYNADLSKLSNLCKCAAHYWFTQLSLLKHGSHHL